jgi:hypothetical protein
MRQDLQRTAGKPPKGRSPLEPLPRSARAAELSTMAFAAPRPFAADGNR